MAQNQGSFLYQLKLDLDAAGAASQFDKHLEGMSVAVQDFGSQLSKMQSKIKDSFANGPQFESMIEDLRHVRRQLNVIGDENPLEKTFGRGRQQLERMERSLREVVRQGARLEQLDGSGLISGEISGFGTASVEDDVDNLSQRFNRLQKEIQDTQTKAQKAFANKVPSGVKQARASVLQLEKALGRVGSGDASIEQLANQFEGLGANVNKLQTDLSTLMGNLEATGQSLRDLATDNPFDHIEEGARRAPRAINEMRQEILQSEASLEDLAASADRSWGRVTQGALEAADGAEKMGASIVQNSNRATSALKDQAATTARVRGTTFSLGSAANSAASQLSIDLTQSAQDAAFGIENLAASAPFLFEQFGRVQKQTGSLTGALGSLASAFMGPTGVIAGFTLLLTFKDQIISFFQDLGSSMSEAASEAEELNTKIEEAFEESRDQFTEGIASDFVEFARQLDPASEASPFGAGGSIEEMIKAPVSAAEILTERFRQVQSILDEFERRQESIQETVEETTSSIESSITAGPREQAIVARTQAGITEQKARERALEQMGLSRESLQALQRQKERLAAVTDNLGLKSMEEARIRNRLNQLYGVEGEELDTLTEKFMKFRKEQEKATEESEEQAEFLSRLRKLRVEAMEEGISKQINAINTSIIARREEIRALDLEADKQERLLDLLDQVAERKKEAALEEFSTVDLQLQDDEEITEAMDRINSKIDERIRKVRNLKGEYSDLSEQQQEQAIQELEQEREEELADVREQALFINGRLVRRDEFIENTKENFNRAQQRIQNELDALRFEQESGVRVGSIFGTDSLFGGLRNTQDQLANLENRFEARRELIREEQEKAGRMLLATGEDKYAEAWANLERKRTQLTKKEAQKRFQITLQNMRKIGNAVESSPIGDATRNLLLDLGSMWQAHSEDRLNFSEKNWKKQATMIGQMGGQVVGAAATIAEQTFKSWKSERAQDLKDEGKSAKERRKILKKEGKKRFRVMKAIKITEASVNTATGVTRALAELPPPASYAAAAATAAAGIFQIKQIAGMSIGDRISGGGGGGSRGGQFTQRAAASSATSAMRVGTLMEQSRNNDEDKIKKTAERVGQEVGRQMPDRVTMDTNTAEQANEAANNQQTKLNK